MFFSKRNVSKKIYIHIGTHKTGTTFIQNIFHKNYQVLKKEKILYPQNGIVQFGHHNIAWHFLKSKRYLKQNGTLENFIDEIINSKADKVFISSEEFDNFKKSEIEELYNALSQLGELNIIFFTRRQDELLKSIWNQRVKNGLVICDFETFCNRTLSAQAVNIALSKKLKFNQYLQQWIKVFGTQNVIVKSYDLEKPAGLEKSFFSILEFNKVRKLKLNNKIVNNSIPLSYIELIRTIAGTINKNERSTVINELSKNVYHILNKEKLQNKYKNDCLVISEKLHNTIRSFFLEDNKELQINYNVEILTDYKTNNNKEIQLVEKELTKPNIALALIDMLKVIDYDKSKPQTNGKSFHKITKSSV